MPCHDGFLAKAEVAAVEPDAVLGDGTAPDFFHCLDPVAGAHRVALAPFHVQAQARAANHAGQRMVARASGLLRVVADGRILLVAVAHHHRGVPVGHGVVRQGVMDHLLGRGEPGFNLGGVQWRTKSAECILATQPAFAHAGDFGHGIIILQTSAMGEARATYQTVQRECLEDVRHGCGVGTGARQGIASGHLVKHPAAFQKMIPRHQSAIRRERLVAATKMKLPARRQEFEIQVPITHWMSQFIACFCLQTAQLSALALLIRNPNCGLWVHSHFIDRTARRSVPAFFRPSPR